ncbi:MAG TPA: carboxypeptidase regulatory-like domain-containing protein [Gemmatimonadales bacterium]|jgi:hypothetical protein
MTRRLIWPFLIVAPVAMLEAQVPRRTVPEPASQTFGSLRGLVYDSLLKGPLEGARVFIDGTILSTMTDADGRFHFDSVPSGRMIIGFEHADLDSAGLSNNLRRIEIAGGRPTSVELDVPSLATMYHAACGATSPVASARDSGVVFGSVRDVGTRARLSGARVTISWVAARLGGARIEVTRPGVVVTTDSVGNYYACGVPRDYIVTAAAAAGRFTSGVTEVLLGERGVSRRDIGISRDSATLADSVGLRKGHATIVGTVLDNNDQPRANVRASVDDALSSSFSDENGHFIVGNLPAGSQMLMLRTVGYTAVRAPVMLRDGDTTRVVMRIRALTVLDTIKITARSGAGDIELADLEERMRNGSGYYLKGEDVRRRNSMRAVFQGLPGLTIEGPSVFEYTLQTLQQGRPTGVSIFVDGLPTDEQAMQSYRPDQIIAVEWYPRGQDAPIRYQSVNLTPVMLIWTRFIR